MNHIRTYVMSNENKFPLKKNDTGRAKGAPSEDHTTPPSSRTASGGILSYLISACVILSYLLSYLIGGRPQATRPFRFSSRQILLARKKASA